MGNHGQSYIGSAISLPDIIHQRTLFIYWHIIVCFVLFCLYYLGKSIQTLIALRLVNYFVQY